MIVTGSPHVSIARRCTALLIAAGWLAGCTAPAQPSPHATATGAPIASASPSAAPTASPSPTVAPGQAIVEAFLAVTQAADRSVHLEVLADFGRSQWAESFDIQGEDFSGSAGSVAPPSSLKRSYLCTDGKGYVIQTDRDGVATIVGVAPGCEMSQRNPDPFADLEPADVEYVGPAAGTSPPAHHLKLRDPVAPLAPLFGTLFWRDNGEPQDVGSSFDVVVDDAGRPLSASLVVQFRSARASQGITAHIELAFSDWGRDLGIAVPDLPLPTPEPPGTEILFVENGITEMITLADSAGHEFQVVACLHRSLYEGELDFDTTHFEVRAVDGSVIAAHSADPNHPNYQPIWLVQVFTDGANFLQPGVWPSGGCYDRPRP